MTSLDSSALTVGARVRVRPPLTARGTCVAALASARLEDASFQVGDVGTVVDLPQPGKDNCVIAFDKHHGDECVRVALRHLQLLTDGDDDITQTGGAGMAATRAEELEETAPPPECKTVTAVSMLEDEGLARNLDKEFSSARCELSAKHAQLLTDAAQELSQARAKVKSLEEQLLEWKHRAERAEQEAEHWRSRAEASEMRLAAIQLSPKATAKRPLAGAAQTPVDIRPPTSLKPSAPTAVKHSAPTAVKPVATVSEQSKANETLVPMAPPMTAGYLPKGPRATPAVVAGHAAGPARDGTPRKFVHLTAGAQQAQAQATHRTPTSATTTTTTPRQVSRAVAAGPLSYTGFMSKPGNVVIRQRSPSPVFVEQQRSLSPMPRQISAQPPILCFQAPAGQGPGHPSMSPKPQRRTSDIWLNPSAIAK
eukprot:TRINITY_DN47541_c0_g2_i1.p1 TRINITY_DN47541_c0_g2~~TRINITY_DN47541_c0_g2_i1.p1  ORF type:complete len:424 (+),score=59.07 TRINITY_DN47541_c0_g2_i1:54-1325(+)